MLYKLYICIWDDLYFCCLKPAAIDTAYCFSRIAQAAKKYDAYIGNEHYICYPAGAFTSLSNLVELWQFANLVIYDLANRNWLK